MNREIIECYCRLSAQYHTNTDKILITPKLRNEFLSQARKLLGNLPEEKLLGRLIALRKKKKLPRSSQVKPQMPIKATTMP